MESRRQLPDEAFIPTRLTIDNETFAELVAELESRPKATAELRELMRGR